MQKCSNEMPQTNIKENSQRRLCASVRSRNAHGHVTKTVSRDNLPEKTGQQIEHPDQRPALTPTVRTPQCEHTDWGKNMMISAGVLQELAS